MKPGLAGVHQHFPERSLVANIREHRRRRAVVVPDVVVHFLEVPLVRAGLEIERDDRHREQIVAAPRGSVVVGTGITNRHVDQSELRVDGRMRPDGTATVLPRVPFPRLVAELSRARAASRTSRLLCRFWHRRPRTGRERLPLPLPRRCRPGRRDRSPARSSFRAPDRPAAFSTRPRRSSDRARSSVLSRRPEKTFPSPTATPRYVPPSVVSCFHLMVPSAASIAKMFPAPEAMNMTPSTTIGVACIVPGIFPSSR